MVSKNARPAQVGLAQAALQDGPAGPHVTFATEPGDDSILRFDQKEKMVAVRRGHSEMLPNVVGLVWAGNTRDLDWKVLLTCSPCLQKLGGLAKIIYTSSFRPGCPQSLIQPEEPLPGHSSLPSLHHPFVDRPACPRWLDVSKRYLVPPCKSIGEGQSAPDALETISLAWADKPSKSGRTSLSKQRSICTLCIRPFRTKTDPLMRVSCKHSR